MWLFVPWQKWLGTIPHGHRWPPTTSPCLTCLPLLWHHRRGILAPLGPWWCGPIMPQHTLTCLALVSVDNKIFTNKNLTAKLLQYSMADGYKIKYWIKSLSLFLLYFTFKLNLKSQCGIMLQFTSVSIQSSFMKTRRVEGREILLAKVICTLIYIVKKSPEKLTKHVTARVTWNYTMERSGMF